MSYHTHEEEKRSELIDETIRNVGGLVLLLLNARTEEQLMEQIRPTSAALLSGRVLVLNCELPRVEAVRHQIGALQELLDKVDTEMRDVNHRVHARLQKEEDKL